MIKKRNRALSTAVTSTLNLQGTASHGRKSVKLQVETIGCNGPVATLASETEAEPRIKGAYRGYTNFRVGAHLGSPAQTGESCKGKTEMADKNVCV